jgi:hypothetical protein
MLVGGVTTYIHTVIYPKISHCTCSGPFKAPCASPSVFWVFGQLRVAVALIPQQLYCNAGGRGDRIHPYCHFTQKYCIVRAQVPSKRHARLQISGAINMCGIRFSFLGKRTATKFWMNCEMCFCGLRAQIYRHQRRVGTLNKVSFDDPLNR